MSYSIFRVAKVKNSVDTRAIQRHNQRENKNYGNKDIDHSKTHLNYDLINPERILYIKNEDGQKQQVVQPNKINYIEKIEERLEEGYQGKRKIRSDAIKHVDGIVTSDKKFFDRLSKNDQDQYFKDSLDFIKQEYGEKNILYATVHLDEKTPHMHFGFVPLTEDGRLSAKEILGNKKALSELQDRFNDFVNEKGYNLERGERATGKEHIEIMKFKEKTLNNKVLGLEKEVHKLQQNVEKVRQIEQKIKKIDELDNKVKEGRFTNKVTIDHEDFQAFKNVAKSGLATLAKYEDLKKTNAEMLEELNQENKYLEKDRNYYKNRNRDLIKENKELKQKNKSLTRELQRYKTFVKNFGEQVKMRMVKLAEKLKFPKLSEVFNQQVFEPSKDYSNNEYAKDKRQEEKELSKEQELER